MNGRRGAVALMAALSMMTVAGCGDDEEPQAVAPPPATTQAAPVEPAVTPSAAAPVSSAPLIPEKTTTGKPEIARNPDGTENTAQVKPVIEEAKLSSGGLGPYKIGAELTALQKAKLVAKVQKMSCPDYTSGRGTAKYHAPELVFYQGKLLRMTISKGGAATNRGIKLGSTMGAVQEKYPEGKRIDDWTGRGAWVAAIGDYGLLFDMTDAKVTGLQAGMAGPMQFKYTDNQGC